MEDLKPAPNPGQQLFTIIWFALLRECVNIHNNNIHDNINNNTIFYLRLDAAAPSSSFGSVSSFFSFVLSFPSLSSSFASLFFPENITKHHEEEEDGGDLLVDSFLP